MGTEDERWGIKGFRDNGKDVTANLAVINSRTTVMESKRVARHILSFRTRILVWPHESGTRDVI